MKIKRISAIIVAIAIVLTCFSINVSAFEGITTGDVSETRLLIEGKLEEFFRIVRRLFETRNYNHYYEICEIPETENGFVPQGYCFSKEENLHFISYYHEEKASVISVVSAESKSRIKTIALKRAGKDFTGHVGGIAVDESHLYVCHGSNIYRLELAEISELNDGESIDLVNYISTDVKCSYLNCDGKYLYAGEFYTYTSDGSYDTDKSHHKVISLFETTYSRCNAYSLDDIAEKFAAEKTEICVPAMVFTTPNCVQGFARLPDGTFALSTSYGRNNDSFLKYYKDVTKGECDFAVEYGEVSVNGYHLRNSAKIATHRQPPMLEGIDDMNGKVAGIFESCAKKYSDSDFITKNICVFE